MKPEELARKTEKGDFPPLCFLYGEESYLIEREATRIISRCVSPDFRDFNLTVFYGNESKGDEILGAAQTLPFFADRRLVVVRNASALSSPAQELLLPYLANPSPSTVLLFVGEKIDLRRKFFLEMKKSGELVEFRRLFENQLGVFVREEAKRLGKQIETQATDYVIHLVGNNLQELVSQMEKAALWCGTASSITLDAVRETASDSRVDTVFVLTKALGEKDLQGALRSLRTLLRDGQEPIQILFMVTRHLRQVWTARELTEKRASSQQIAATLGMKSAYFLPEMIRQGGNFTRDRMMQLFKLLWECDQNLKSVRVQPAIILERLIWEICS